MKMVQRFFLLCVISSLLPTFVLAESKTKKASSPWDGSKASLGFNMTSGNSNTLTSNGELDIDYKRGIWTVETQSGFQYGSSGGELNKQQLNFTDQLSYSFNHNNKIDNYAYIESSYQTNKFAAYKSQLLITTGYGRDWIKDPKSFQFSTQAGPGYRVTDAANDKPVDHDIAASFSAVFKKFHFIGGTFEQDLTFTVGHPATSIKGVATFSTTLKKNLAINTSVTTTYMNAKAAGLDGKNDYDTTVTVNLVYSLA